jgi:hypothetical protein
MEDVRIISINQHLSYYLMRHDASGKGPGLTFDEDICDIVTGGGCYNLAPADTPKTIRMMIGRRLVACSDVWMQSHVCLTSTI